MLSILIISKKTLKILLTPELISGYDSTGNAIVNLTNSLEDLNNAYDETLKKEAIKSL